MRGRPIRAARSQHRFFQRPGTVLARVGEDLEQEKHNHLDIAPWAGRPTVPGLDDEDPGFWSMGELWPARKRQPGGGHLVCGMWASSEVLLRGALYDC